ncbi:MAG: hypothetical protein KGM96_04700 [Acidobacteriota bacterium]|nr:hypothetical protein [Acidobacteriota bacterium]
MKNSLHVVAAAGLALGAVLGMAGTMAAAPNLRAAFWALDSVGLVVATSILAISYFRKGKDAIAAGFLVYAIGEAVMLSGTAATLEASVPAFAAGTALWSAALLLTSVPREFDHWTRATGILGALLFAVTSAKIFWGEQLTPIARPLPFYAYPFLVFTFAGWTWTLLRER